MSCQGGHCLEVGGLVISDLTFYQSALHNMGIKYVLSQKPQNRHSGSSSNRSNAVGGHPGVVPPRPSIYSGPESDSSPDMDTVHDIPPFLLKYRRPAYSVWSYYNLPEDISRGFTNPRGDLITSILKHLQWSKRAYTFWPLSNLEENATVPDIDLFFKGIRLIKPVYIFIFGSKAFHALLEDREFSYGPHICNDQQIIALPDFDSLLPNNRLLKDLVWNILNKYTPPLY